MGKRISLDSFCEKKIETLSVQYDGLIDYVDISSVDNTEKRIMSTQCLVSKEAPSRAKQLIKVGDILVSTVRPNLNAVAMVEAETENVLVGSTGYCVLRCDDTVNKRFVFYFCQSSYFVDDMSSQATGASYPAVNSRIVRSSLIPLYSFEEQKWIADLFDRVSNLISFRKQQLQKLDELVKARFVELFGDPVSNEKGWPLVTLGDVAEIRIGPFGTLLHKEDYIVGGHALVNPSHIVDGNIHTDEKLTISDEKYDELSAYHLYVGDVVLGRRGEMGRCAVVYQEGLLCGTGSMVIRSNEKMKPYFLQNIISTPAYKKIIEDKAVGVTMMNLNVPIVSSLTIPLLPIDMQEQFIEFMHQTDRSKMAVQQSLDKLELLKNALMQKYFG